MLLLFRLSLSAVFIASAVRDLRREELVGREVDAAEHCAGIIRCSNAFFLRNAEVIGRNQKLYISDNLDNGEDAECYIYGTIRTKVEFAAETSADAFRNSAAAVAAVVRAVANSGGEADRLCDLAGCLREYIGVVLRIQFILCKVGAEHLYIAFAAIQNDSLAEYGYTIDNGRVRRQRAKYVQIDIEEEGHVDRIESLVERHRLQIQKYGDDAGTSEPDICCVFNQFMMARREINSQIFKAIFITTMVRINTGDLKQFQARTPRALHPFLYSS